MDEIAWESVASYVATFPDVDREGACDVRVQVGRADDRRWYVRTGDDAGGGHEVQDGIYATRAEAVDTAEDLALARDEALDGEDAEAYLARQLMGAAGEEDPRGEWACYWSTVGDDEHAESRYATREQAQAAVDSANRELDDNNPGPLLCGYEVRVLDDGRWIRVGEET